jgi:formylglycine-generating enzyme required for sulfatase activity
MPNKGISIGNKLKIKILLTVIVLTFTIPLLSVNGFTEDDPFFSDMVFVNGGNFEMGSNRVQVTLTYDFYISKYEVTFDEWDAYEAASPTAHFPSDCGWGRGKRPVINVSWYDAIKYSNWKSKNEGLPVSYTLSGHLLDHHGKRTTDITQVEGYRLPTETEWEYVSRNKGIRSLNEFSGGENANEVAWYIKNSDIGFGLQTHPVGNKLPNELGIFDMSGNVWEWCQDRYTEKIIHNQTNPIGPPYGCYRVARGGCAGSNTIVVQVSMRSLGIPYERACGIGFRLARTISQGPPGVGP